VAYAFSIAGVSGVASFDLTAQANSPTFTARVCRSNVAPCQKVINLPVGETVTLDLLLDNSGGSSPIPVAAWETHYQLTNTSTVGRVPVSSSGEPVQEQGDGTLALEGLTPLRNSADETTAQYYTVQNQYNTASGQFDYAVTLLRFSPARPAPQVSPFSDNSRLLLGRITLKGVAQGSADLVAGVSSQAVIITSSGQLQSLGATSNSPLLNINVGQSSTPEFLGQLAPQTASDASIPGPLPLELTITFWPEGAVPPWLGGSTKPVAVFRSVTTDEQGLFRITDIPPSVLPPGQYDVRVQGRRTLATLSQGVTFPGPSGMPAAVSVNSGNLRGGDIDGNNIIDNLDLLSLKASFGRLAGETGFNDNADLNRDGVVDAQDFSSMSRSFNQRGE
jgi:Dockerin type I domain